MVRHQLSVEVIAMVALAPDLSKFWDSFLVALVVVVGGIALAAFVAGTGGWLRRHLPHGRHTRPRAA